MDKEQKKTITLEDITLQKEAKIRDIRIQHEILGELSREVFNPFTPSVNGGNSLLKKFNTGVAIFDGVMIGLKIIKSIRQFFRR